MAHRLLAACLSAAVLALTVAATAGPATAGPAAAGPGPSGPVAYAPPVDAAVAIPFQPPTTRYGPGHRGLEYATTAGTPVRAAADGRVTFAGAVAGALHVTLLHADGLRTTDSFLATIDVVVGQSVHQGDRLGTTSGPLLLTARDGDGYLDPSALFAPGPPHVELVPFDIPPGAGLGGERSAIRQLLGGLGAAGSAVLGAAGTLSAETVDWLRAHGQPLLLAVKYLPALDSAIGAVELAYSAAQAVRAAWEIAHRPCTPAGTAVAVPAERRIAVLVAGLGSTSEHDSIDDVHPASLGYAAPDVVRFSYRGGRTPDTGGSVPSARRSSYGQADTGQDLRVSGRRLADLVEAVAHDQPGVPIDLIAHSQGGLVMRLALLDLEARHGRAWLDRLGLVASLATPYGGSDLATGGTGLRATVVARPIVDALTRSVMGMGSGAASLAQLSETSELIHDLDDHPLAPGLHALSIAARGDPIVPLPRARLEGAPEVVVPLVGPSAHRELPGSAGARRELALALAGRPPGCEGFGDALLDQAVGMAISHAEDAVVVAPLRGP